MKDHGNPGPADTMSSALYESGRVPSPYVCWVERDGRAVTGNLSEANAIIIADNIEGVAVRTQLFADPILGRFNERHTANGWERA